MAYLPIILRKIKYSYGGNDYDLRPTLIPAVDEIRGMDAGENKNFIVWLGNPANVEVTNTFNFTGADNSEDGRINKGRIISSVNENALDLVPIFKSLSIGQDLIFWREDLGKGIAWVWRKETATEFRVGTLAYGTYTWGNKISVQPGTSYGWFEPDPVLNVVFLHNSQTERFHWLACRYYSNDAAHGYNSEPVYFTSQTDYYWTAYAQVIAALCTGNYYVPGNNYDPYADTGESAEDQVQTGPAQGSHDDSTDTISIPGAPALNLTLNHFLSAYVPDITTLNGLADFIWGNYDRFDSSKKLSKLFADPSDAIISLHMLPFEPSSSTAIEVTVGRYGSGVNMPPLTAQFKDISCGSVTIDPYWANYLDHNPFTRYTLFLPYVGEVQLDPDEITGETISVDYRVDCLTGAFVCFVSTSTKILAQYQGNCSLQVPTSSADYSRLNSAILTAATAAVGGAVGIGAAAASAGTVGAGIAAGAGEAAKGLPGLAGNAMNVQQSKVNHSHSGALGGASGFMGSQKPYLLIHRARQSVPADANVFKGYPCNAKFNLSDLEGFGFTSVRSIKLDGIKLTDGELEELRQILSAGVYL